MAEDRFLLIGCGILQREIRCLIEKNNWPIDTHFLDSALHINFEKLADKLTSGLEHFRDRRTIVFYGSCHPLMDGILKRSNTLRTAGQNCVDILLGNEIFSRELQRGAFFLMEEWARRWDEIVRLTLGSNLALIRDIYQEAHSCLLCLRTPCSGDFTEAAEEAGRLVGLPLEWRDVGLEHLEGVLLETMRRREEG